MVLGGYMVWGVHDPGGGAWCQGVHGPWGWGVHGPGGWGVHGPGGGLVETPRTATAAGGTHPTGMHSCYLTFPISEEQHVYSIGNLQCHI